ncbi:MAG: glycosyltransferase family 9 protein [Candidatus Omnitrophota bacterium]
MPDLYKVKDFSQDIFKTVNGAKTFAELRHELKSIVVYKGGGGLGDLITAIPFYRTIKTVFPQAKLIYLGIIYPRFRTIFQAIPYIDEKIEYSHSDKLSGLLPYMEFRKKIKNLEIDLLIDTQRRFMTSWALSFLPHKYFLSNSANCLFSNWRYPQPDRHNVHLAAQLMSMLGVLGLRDYTYDLSLKINDHIKQRVKDYFNKLKQPQKKIAIIPGAGIRYKCYSTTKYAGVANKLSRLGFTVVLLGSAAEKDLLKEVARQMESVPIIPSFDQEDFGREILYGAEILSQCRLAICNDSGGMHLSTAVGTPVVALFGPTNPAKTGPLGNCNIVISKNLTCSPCKSWTCPRNRDCLENITVDDIIDAVLFLLRKNN